MQQRDAPFAANRISVVGSSGSGKTWLARRLAGKLGLPLHELDVERDACLAAHGSLAERAAALAAAPGWVIDGHYREARSAVWARAETVVLLDYPAALVAWRLAGRFLGKRRPNDPENPVSPRRASWRRRLSRLWRTFAERGEYERVLSQPRYAHLEVVRLTGPEETRRWLERVEARLA